MFSGIRTDIKEQILNFSVVPVADTPQRIYIPN